ncbi:MAG: cytochrome P450 [Gammaproteobacteria bacterium]|tara:strand:- start:24 stop:1325 length:1302 start_codon:yes stop_codon:yes gene_type:complete
MKSIFSNFKNILLIGAYKILVIFEKLTNRGIALDFISKDYIDNPYKTYNSMRSHKPILFSQTTRLHWVTKMEFAQEMLRDKRFSVDDRKYPIAEKRRKEFKKAGREIMLEQFENPSMLKLDPPDHSRIRKLVQYGFTNRYITSLEPEIKKIVEDCLDKVHNQDSFDLIEDLAKPLPAIVIGKMMGLPNEDLDKFQAWSEDLLVGVGGIGTSREDIKKSGDAYEALINYFERIILARKDSPGEDFIGKLIQAEEEGDKLNIKEMYGTCLLLLIAGHETTTRLIGNGMFALFNHPEQMSALKNEFGLIPNAIEEMLRYEPPVHATVRFAENDLSYDGKSYKRGTAFAISIAGANRDPDANANPNEFDIFRKDIKHISFGYGPHMCIGASLARIESRLAFEVLFERFKNLSLKEEHPKWGKNLIFRGFDNLKIEIA